VTARKATLIPGDGIGPEITAATLKVLDAAGLYVGYETTMLVNGDSRAVAQAAAILTRHWCERIARYAFDYAVAHGRCKVTICHKANILKATSGLFLETARAIAADYVGLLEVDDVIIDACAMKLVLDLSV